MNINLKSLEKLRELINEETEYRSGPKLVSFFNELGFNDSYRQGFPSRWFFTEKDFRNYIHPRQQASQNFNPDKHTAEISWKVLQATIANLIGDRK